MEKISKVLSILHKNDAERPLIKDLFAKVKNKERWMVQN